jgi:peptidoglycan-N-acetylglucosamine deacetylase
MRKSAALILIYLFFATFLLSCNNTVKPQISNPAAIKAEAVQTEPNKDTQDTKPISSTETAEPKKPVIHEIFGDSNKLGEKEKASMLKWRKDIYQFAAENPDLIYLNGQKEEKVVSLTFDDGPDNINTPKILDILKKYNVKGSFFFIGNRLDSFKSVVKRAAAEGNLVLNHSWSHPDLIHKDAAIINQEITSTQNKIFDIIGKKPALIRPPYGDIDKKVLEALNQDDYKYVIWSIDTLDWSQRESANIVKNVLENVRPGDIILMHSNEDKKATAEALPLIIKGLAEKGYKFEDLGQMLGVNPYKD